MSNEVMNSLSRLSLCLGAWIPTQDEAININEWHIPAMSEVKHPHYK